MSAVAERPPGRQRRAGVPVEVRPPFGGRNRRTLIAIASLVVICMSVAAFADLYASAGHKTAAVVVEQALVQGQPITGVQLGQADVSVSAGVSYIPVSEASQILGKRAASAVPVGSLLTTADLTATPALAPGSAIVGVALKAGQLPAEGLVAGDRVMIVQTAIPGSPLSAPVTPTSVAPSSPTSSGSGSPSSAGTGATVLSGGSTGVLVPSAGVFTVASPSATAGGGYAVLVSVEVPSTIAADVATAASAGQVSLVLLPRPANGAASTGTGATP